MENWKKILFFRSLISTGHDRMHLNSTEMQPVACYLKLSGRKKNAERIWKQFFHRRSVVESIAIRIENVSAIFWRGFRFKSEMENVDLILGLLYFHSWWRASFYRWQTNRIDFTSKRERERFSTYFPMNSDVSTIYISSVSFANKKHWNYSG